MSGIVTGDPWEAVPAERRMWQGIPAEKRPHGWNYPEEMQNPAAGAFEACMVCGVLPQKGLQALAWAPLAPLDPRGPTEAGGVLADQPWRHRHESCLLEASWIVEAIIGRPVAREVAHDAVQAYRGPLTARSANSTSKRPFGHLMQAERDRLAALVSMMEAAETSSPSPHGRCGWCGVGRSASWASVRGVSWRDGSACELCADCAVAAPSDAYAGDADDLRVRALALMAGVRIAPALVGFKRTDGSGERDYWGFKPFMEVATPDERHDAEAERWTYGDGRLERVRSILRELRPELIEDPDERAEGMRRLDELRAEDAESRQQAVSSPVSSVSW